MKMLKIAFLGETFIAEDTAKRFTQESIKENSADENCVIDFYKNPMSFMLEHRQFYDLILIEVGKSSADGGIATLKWLRSCDVCAGVICVSDDVNDAILGYEYDAVGFLIAPIDYKSFNKVFARALKRYYQFSQGYVIAIKNDYLIRLPISQVRYVCKEVHDLVYYTETGVYSIRCNLKEMENFFFKNQFIKINRGCLVNPAYVEGIGNGNVLVAGTNLAISRSLLKDCNQQFKSLLKNRLGS